MNKTEITREQVKQWVVIHSRVINPYGRNYYQSVVTLLFGMDIYGEGDTKERAYNDLTDKIFTSPYYLKFLIRKTTFKLLNP